MRSINPFTGEILKDHAPDSASIINQKLEKSARVFSKYSASSLSHRSEIIRKLGEILLDRSSELSIMITREMGKLIRESRAEIEKCSALCSFYADNLEEFLSPRTVSASGPDLSVNFKALGPLLGIMPWNFPFWQVLRFAVPALSAGNTVLLKHSSNVQFCAEAIEKIFLEAGFPDGVFQNLRIPGSRVSRLIKSTEVKALSLTGSEHAGRLVASQAGTVLKKCILELGGSDAYLILKDADLELAAEKVFQSRMVNSGQSCIGAKRILVHSSLFEAFEEAIINKAAELTFGDPELEASGYAPLSSPMAVTELKSQVESSVKAGASMRSMRVDDKGCNAHFPITLLKDINKNSPAYSEELFGPVFSLFKCESLDQMLEIANSGDFGLAGAIFSRDIEKARHYALEKLQAGSVAVNDFVRSDPRMPFGGIKSSGFGRELSKEGILEFVNIKSLSV